MVSRVIIATMLFLNFILFSSSFVGTLKSEIPGTAMELCQLKLKQLSSDILQFSTKHEDNPFTLNCFIVPRTCFFIFDAGSRTLGSNNFRNSSYKEKTAGLARVSKLSFHFLWLWWKRGHPYAPPFSFLTGKLCWGLLQAHLCFWNYCYPKKLLMKWKYVYLKTL